MTSLPEGFVAHSGGPCPLAADTLVTVMFLDGAAGVKKRAGFWSKGTRDWWRWEDPNHRNDIIAYKVETSNAD